ncbi:calcyphosin-2-like [Rhopilema esculentum]|uniref:calcyphosin-2-like n=1 Tax=Rhopilema esculentum TaxID=499914 RepID=UPI0031D3A458
MSFPLDLTITGKPTPRTNERPGSGRKPQRPLSANRARSTKSNIFGDYEDDRKVEKTERRPTARVKSAPSHKTKDVKSPYDSLKGASVISKSELEAVKSITSTEDSEDKRAQIRHPAPEGVPKLQLGNLIDKDNRLQKPVDDYKPSIATPNSASSVDWGTPLNSRRPPSGKKPKGGGWQVNQSRPVKPISTPKPKKHDDVPSLDLQLSKSNEGLKELTKVARMVHEDLKIEYMGAPKKVQAAHDEEKVLDNQFGNSELEDDERQPENDTKNAAIDLNKLGESRKKHFVEETLLVDQLTRSAISAKPFTPNTPDPLDSRQKRHRDLFSSSSPITGPSSDSSLLKRLRFGARILTRNGHDAHREINGFFFPNDGTITMYEFRQFGTRSNALPFIQRGSYNHIKGPRKGRQFTLLDIQPGRDLQFRTENQASLPDSLKGKPIIAFRITEVDGTAKEKLLFDGCRTPKERSERESWIDSYESAEEKQRKEILIALRGSIQKKLKKRAVKTVVNLGKHFRKMNKSGDGALDKDVLIAALHEFRIEVPEECLDIIWQTVDTNEHGKVDYDEFVRKFLGDMNEYRKMLVRKAFARLDTSKNGWTAKDNLKKFFNGRKHPRVVSGELSEQIVINEFFSNFEETEKKGEVSYSEFEDYYEGLSIQVDTDEEFTAIMRSSWGV